MCCRFSGDHRNHRSDVLCLLVMIHLPVSCQVFLSRQSKQRFSRNSFTGSDRKQQVAFPDSLRRQSMANSPTKAAGAACGLWRKPQQRGCKSATRNTRGARVLTGKPETGLLPSTLAHFLTSRHDPYEVQRRSRPQTPRPDHSFASARAPRPRRCAALRIRRHI